ncbi:MAG: DUF4386 domain-containing protein [Terriglobia bacterium]
MSTAVTMGRNTEASPRLIARIAGALYLLIFVTAPFAEIFVRGKLVVYGDAAATATNILAHEPLYRLGAAAELITLLCDAAVALIFYELLKPVGRSLALLAAFFRLIFVAIMAVNSLNLFVPLVLLKGEQFLSAFTTSQLQAVALVSQKLYGVGYGISLVFFGFHCVLIGYLIFRSAYLPQILGALVAAAGLSYLTNSFADILSPAFAAHLYPYILVPAGVAELSLTLWLLVVGVNAERWKEQAGTAGGPPAHEGRRR